jgi:hypothetical protein
MDPLSLTALGAVAAAEGIKFLYGQGAELIKAWRARRADDATLDVPIIPNDILDHPPTTAVAAPGVVLEQEETLLALVGSLSNYAHGLAPINPNDKNLGRLADLLRSTLEAVYGQRLTFRGEQRDPTGTRVTVEQAVRELQGRMTGYRGPMPSGIDLSIVQHTDVVDPGGVIEGISVQPGPEEPQTP